MLWLPEGKQANRGLSWLPVATSQVRKSASEPSPFHDHPPWHLYSKGKRKRSKTSEWVRAQGPHPSPTTSYSKSATGKAKGKPGPGHTPIWQCPEAPVSSITAKAFYPPPANLAGGGAATSVLIDSKNPDSMELGQLGDEHAHQGHSVEYEVDLVILGVEAGEEVPGGEAGRQTGDVNTWLPR